MKIYHSQQRLSLHEDTKLTLHKGGSLLRIIALGEIPILCYLDPGEGEAAAEVTIRPFIATDGAELNIHEKGDGHEAFNYLDTVVLRILTPTSTPGLPPIMARATAVHFFAVHNVLRQQLLSIPNEAMARG